MQIIIPMSGVGQRFSDAGYAQIKPMIEVDGKPIIAHVLDLFPSESNIIFICNNDHLNDGSLALEETLKTLAPTSRIVGVAPHKLGPVHAIEQVADILDLDKPTIVNYCDFSCVWNWSDFKTFVSQNKPDGAIIAYRGFHPHSLGKDKYAYLRLHHDKVVEVREKESFTNNKMDEFASSGTYYFASAKIMLGCFAAQKRNDHSINGEYYVSLAYNELIGDGGTVVPYEIDHFMQWGTPKDLEEYLHWSSVFKKLSRPAERPKNPVGSLVIPMAGEGKRFAENGYSVPKPLILVNDKPMVKQAVDWMPDAEQTFLISRQDLQGNKAVREAFANNGQDVHLVELEGLTEGQASTVSLGCEEIERQSLEMPAPITVGICDSGLWFNSGSLEQILCEDYDVIVWVARGYLNAARSPEQYGWVVEESGLAVDVSVKNPLGNPESDPIVTGAFTFRTKDVLQELLSSQFLHQNKVNGEYYLDSCIEECNRLGFKCLIFEVEEYISWGTPNELKTYEYWQQCFTKWDHHPYR